MGRRCSLCGCWKGRHDFYTVAPSGYGITARCKRCIDGPQAAYRAEYKRMYANRHREHVRAHYTTNRPRIREQQRQYYQKRRAKEFDSDRN